MGQHSPGQHTVQYVVLRLDTGAERDRTTACSTLKVGFKSFKETMSI